MFGRARTIWIASAAAAVVLLVGFAAHRAGLIAWDADALVRRVRASGPLGPLVLIALLVAQAVVAPLPSPPLFVAAGFLYGPWLGIAIGWFGLLLGASACFVLARAYGRPFVQRFVRSEQLATIDAYLAERGGATLLAIVAMRVFMPPLFDPVSYACGLLRVSFPLFAVATGLGELPKVGTFTYIGAAAGEVPGWLTTWVLLAPAIGVIALRLFARRRRSMRQVANSSACVRGSTENGVRRGGLMPTRSFDLIETYVVLHDDGSATPIEVTPTFWPDVMAGKHPELGEGHLVAVFPYEANWTSAEMHPAGDELVYVLSGAVDLILEEPGGDRTIALEAGNGHIVPKGVWHTARVRKRGKVLHVTSGAGTEHRPL